VNGCRYFCSIMYYCGKLYTYLILHTFFHLISTMYWIAFWKWKNYYQICFIIIIHWSFPHNSDFFFCGMWKQGKKTSNIFKTRITLLLWIQLKISIMYNRKLFFIFFYPFHFSTKNMLKCLFEIEIFIYCWVYCTEHIISELVYVYINFHKSHVLHFGK
jgi:hypothetical protein